MLRRVKHNKQDADAAYYHTHVHQQQNHYQLKRSNQYRFMYGPQSTKKNFFTIQAIETWHVIATVVVVAALAAVVAKHPVFTPYRAEGSGCKQSPTKIEI